MNQVAKAFRWTGAQNKAELVVVLAILFTAIACSSGGVWIGYSAGWRAAMSEKPEEVRTASADERRGSVRIVIEGISFWVKATGKPSEYDVSTDGDHFYRVGPNGAVD